ncbi:MAG: TolC family protein [Cyclobacteriaceae bacterium]
MKNYIIKSSLLFIIILIGLAGCKSLDITEKTPDISLPTSYESSTDTTNAGQLTWQEYFTDVHLIALIDTALKNNQELNITMQEINIARNEVMDKKGEYLPFVGLGAGAGMDKVGRYTRNGALEANNEIKPGKEFPEPLGDYTFGAYATWEVDIWKKLRNAKKSAYTNYLASIEGRNFLATNLISEIANSYYELLALDQKLNIVKQNIEIQNDALRIVKLQKESARVTELAVKRFEALVLDTKSLQFLIEQEIVVTENKLNFLVGRYPQATARNADAFNQLMPNIVLAGIPSQLLQNRPDIRQAELELAAANLDIKVAKARFYPSLDISAGIGYQAFNPSYLLNTPESMLFRLAGDLVAPVVNRNAIKAMYYNANAKQIQAVYQYEQTILKAYIEVANQLSNMNNLDKRYSLKEEQVSALIEAVSISNNLFRGARADYMEVLLTQRDALESRFDLVETKMEQMRAWVGIYRALGGGWR